jgi:hypothetical protein
MAGQKDPVKLYYFLALIFYMELFSIGGSFLIYKKTLVKYHSFCIEALT